TTSTASCWTPRFRATSKARSPCWPRTTARPRSSSNASFPSPNRSPNRRPGMHNHDIDLFFPTIAEREVQYNARESVPDFDACVRRYAESSARVRARRPGVLDLRYGMGQDERLDLFLPAASQAPAPLFVFIHGGYWRAQRKEDAPVMAEAFNAAGAAVATLEYTLVPEATLGEVVREVRSAVAWLYRNVAAYGVDPERIYVSGSSAGGHLAGMLAAPKWQARYGVPDDVIKG